MKRTIALAVVAVASISTGLTSVSWATPPTVDSLCVAFPLPTSPTGLSWTGNVGLSYNVIVWRQACTADASKSVLLARIIPTGGGAHPLIKLVTQTNIVYGASFRYQNTGDNIIDYGDPFTPMYVATTAVIERPSDVRFEAEFQVAFTFIDFFTRESSIFPLNVPAAADTRATSFPNTSTSYYANYSGNWWNPAEDGAGFQIIQGPSNQLFIIWFTYTDAGEPLWVFASGGTWTDAQTFTGGVYQARGTSFRMPWNPSQRQANPVGTFTVKFTTANNATLDYSVSGATGTKVLTRLIF